MGYLRITQVRSSIGRQQVQRQVLRGLGIKRMHQSVVVEDRPEIRGMARKIPHLVEVEEMVELPPGLELTRGRRSRSGS